MQRFPRLRTGDRDVLGVWLASRAAVALLAVGGAWLLSGARAGEVEGEDVGALGGDMMGAIEHTNASNPKLAAMGTTFIEPAWGEPEEMANAVLFLASDESSFITASTFLVDGGISGAYVTPL